MASSTKALVVALIALIVCPILLYIEGVALLFSAMVTYEESNPVLVKVASVVVVILIGVVAIALPVTAFIMGKRARSFIRSSDNLVAGASRALTAQVIAGVVAAGAVILPVYLILMVAGGLCSFGC